MALKANFKTYFPIASSKLKGMLPPCPPFSLPPHSRSSSPAPSTLLITSHNQWRLGHMKRSLCS